MALRSPLPWGCGIGFGVGGVKGLASRVAASRLPALPGRVLCDWLQTSYCQSTILPLASSVAATSATIAGPKGSHACSSSRIHCTRTGMPGKARAISAASAATSSAPLWP